MWFKNLHVFRLLVPFRHSMDELEALLQGHVFQPCGRLEMNSQGWVAPLGKEGKSLLHGLGQCVLLCARKEEKILPTSVIRDFVNERLEEIESQQLRKVRKQEREAIRDAVLQELLPRAFTRSNYQYAYLDLSHGWLLVDTSSRKKAEEFVNFLRQSLGSLPVISPKLRDSPSRVMTQWLGNRSRCPEDFELADACELVEIAMEGSVVNCKRQDLLAEEIHAHLEAGKLVSRLALRWQSHLSFVVDEDLVLRRLQFLEITSDQGEDFVSRDRVVRFDADFALMTGEFSRLLPRLFQVFGGEDEEVYQQAALGITV